MPRQKRPEITNEEMVCIWLAYEQQRRQMGLPTVRRHHPGEAHNEFTMHEIEDDCWRYWQERGAKASRSTLVRACWRVMREGLLGKITRRKPEGCRFFVFRYTAAPAELVGLTGRAWQAIAHGKEEHGETGQTDPGA